MNFVADENIDTEIIDHLRNAGYEIFSISEEFPGVPDEDVIKITNEHNALLLTADKDFGELVYRERKGARRIHTYWHRPHAPYESYGYFTGNRKEYQARRS